MLKVVCKDDMKNVRACVRACVRVCMRACMRACVRVCVSQISIWLLGLLWILSRSWMSLSRSDCTEQSLHKWLEKIRIIGMSVNVAVCCCQSTTAMMYLKQHAAWPLWTYVKIEDGLKNEDNRRNEDGLRNGDDHSLRKSKDLRQP